MNLIIIIRIHCIWNWHPIFIYLLNSIYQPGHNCCTLYAINLMCNISMAYTFRNLSRENMSSYNNETCILLSKGNYRFIFLHYLRKGIPIIFPLIKRVLVQFLHSNPTFSIVKNEKKKKENYQPNTLWRSQINKIHRMYLLK